MKVTELSVLSDEKIVDMYWNRNESAIAETDRKYRNYLYTIAYHILFNPEDSDECLNDTYLKTWNAIPPATPKLFKAFLARIIRNTAIDRYDAEKRQKRIPPELCDSLADFEGFLSDDRCMDDILEAQAIGRIITEYLDSVSARKQYIFMSRYYFMIPTIQIAEKLSISQSAVQKVLANMKQALGIRLQKGGIDL